MVSKLTKETAYCYWGNLFWYDNSCLQFKSFLAQATSGCHKIWILIIEKS